jgi:stage III sporulation protein AD
MEFGAVLGLGLVTTLLLIILRKERPEIAMLLAAAAALLILGAMLQKINAILLVFETLAAKADLNQGYFKIILRIIGFAYLAGFGAQLCRDAGENGMAGKIELAGKLFILSLGLPVMAGLVDLVFRMF